MLKISNLTKKYERTIILDNINIELDYGHIYGLLGINGAGKTTLLRTIAGILTHSEGEIILDDETIYENNNAKQNIFFLPDEPYHAKFTTLNTYKEVYKKNYTNFDELKYKSLLEELDINENKVLNNFSKGMLKRSFIILALCSNAKILLLDETFDGIDPIIRTKLKKHMLEYISDNDATIILSTHNINELDTLADTLLLLNHNKMQQPIHIDNFQEKYIRVKTDINLPETFTIIEHKKTINGNIYTLPNTNNIVYKQIYDLKPNTLERMYIPLEDVFSIEMEIK